MLKQVEAYWGMWRKSKITVDLCQMVLNGKYLL